MDITSNPIQTSRSRFAFAKKAGPSNTRKSSSSRSAKVSGSSLIGRAVAFIPNMLRRFSTKNEISTSSSASTLGLTGGLLKSVKSTHSSFSEPVFAVTEVDEHVEKDAEYQTLLLINQSNETSIHNDKKDTLQVSPLKNFDKTAEADFDKTVDDRQKPEGRTNSDDLGRPTKLSSGKCSKPIESELQPSSASSTTASECMSVTSMTSVKSSKSLQTKDANNDFK